MDLTNKNTEYLNIIIEKYSSLISNIPTNDKKYYANIIDVGVNYIKDKYSNINRNLKSASILLLFKKYNEINHDSDIFGIIDDFITFHKNNHNQYINQIDDNTSDFIPEFDFLYYYLKSLNNFQEIS